jgi:hypothetical protein
MAGLERSSERLIPPVYTTGQRAKMISKPFPLRFPRPNLTGCHDAVE